MRISDWSSDVCSSDLRLFCRPHFLGESVHSRYWFAGSPDHHRSGCWRLRRRRVSGAPGRAELEPGQHQPGGGDEWRSEEHTSELQSLMRISYAVVCLKKKKTYQQSMHPDSNEQEQDRKRQEIRV